MSVEVRLERLYPALSAQERAVMVLRALKAHEKPDRTLYRSAPDDQFAEFNRLVRLMNCVNVEVAAALFVIREQVAKTDLRYAWLMTALMWGAEVQLLGHDLLVATKDAKVRNETLRWMARAPGDGCVPVDLTADLPEAFGDKLVHGLLLRIASGLQQHWSELRAIAIVLDEVAEEFGGEDPMHADLRAILSECLASCTSLRDAVSDYETIELLEPSDEELAAVRALIEKVVHR